MDEFENFERNHVPLKEGIKLSDLLNGVNFSIDTSENDCYQNYGNEVDFLNFPNIEENFIPFDKTFEELKEKMTEVCDGVWKISYREAPVNASQVNFALHRVTYHRNLYMENEPHPFDSTYMNSKPDVICNDTEKYLEGILDALSSMKQGEQSYFVIAYKKMFKEQGCLPRVLPKSDILCDLKVIKVEEIGDQKNIEELENESDVKPFAKAKLLVQDGKTRGKFLFNNQKKKEAIKIYQKSLHVLELCMTSSDEELNERRELKINLLMNLAICFNLQGEPKKSLKFISQIETLCDISNNSKMLFIKGKALRLNGDYKEAAIALNKANSLRPYNQDVMKELEKLDECMAKSEEIDKKFAKSLFIN